MASLSSGGSGRYSTAEIHRNPVRYKRSPRQNIIITYSETDDYYVEFSSGSVDVWIHALKVGVVEWIQKVYSVEQIG